MKVSRNYVLAGGAVALAVIALLAGDRSRASHDDVDLAQLARDVEEERDHVTAVELAEWIRARKPLLRVVDVRSQREFEEYHIPGAHHVPVGAIAALPLRAGETIVLYSEGGIHAAQGWFFLRARGARDVYFLRGGLNEWLDDVMSPPLAPSDTARRQLSRYFGGRPTLGSEATNAPPLTTREKVGRLRRGTC